MTETLGEIIREKRSEKKISLRKLAEILDISPAYLCQIEKNVVVPTIERIHDIAKALDVNVDMLLSIVTPVDLVELSKKYPAFITTIKDYNRFCGLPENYEGDYS